MFSRCVWEHTLRETLFSSKASPSHFRMSDGEEAFSISTPSAGLWASDTSLNNPTTRASP